MLFISTLYTSIILGAQTDCIKPSFKQRYHDAYVAELHHFHDLINKPNVRFYYTEHLLKFLIRKQHHW